MENNVIRNKIIDTRCKTYLSCVSCLLVISFFIISIATIATIVTIVFILSPSIFSR